MSIACCFTPLKIAEGKSSDTHYEWLIPVRIGVLLVAFSPQDSFSVFGEGKHRVLLKDKY